MIHSAYTNTLARKRKICIFTDVINKRIKSVSIMILYHGTNMVVRCPEVRVSGYNKDFGFGFYCTRYEKQAKRWALTKRGTHIVCVYDYTPNTSLNVKSFSEMSDEWLDFVAVCRHGKSHSFDIIEGPMADDEVWDYVEDFLSGRISRDAFWALARFKRPTHQILFCTDRALDTLSFKSYYEL